MNEQKPQYLVTSQFFRAYGGAIDVPVTKYVNEYTKENGVRLINVVANGDQLIFFWAQK